MINTTDELEVLLLNDEPKFYCVDSEGYTIITENYYLSYCNRIGICVASIEDIRKSFRIIDAVKIIIGSHFPISDINNGILFDLSELIDNAELSLKMICEKSIELSRLIRKEIIKSLNL